MITDMKWTRKPEKYSIQSDRVEITTMPHTDLWQRTYYTSKTYNAKVASANAILGYYPQA